MIRMGKSIRHRWVKVVVIFIRSAATGIASSTEYQQDLGHNVISPPSLKTSFVTRQSHELSVGILVNLSGVHLYT